jgi:hypothetical protein
LPAGLHGLPERVFPEFEGRVGRIQKPLLAQQKRDLFQDCLFVLSLLIISGFLALLIAQGHDLRSHVENVGVLFLFLIVLSALDFFQLSCEPLFGCQPFVFLFFSPYFPLR